MAQSTYSQEGCLVDYTATAACSAGDIIKLPNGLAGQVVTDIAAGALGAVRVEGIIEVAKTDAIAFLPGGDAYWIVATSKAHFRPGTGANDFYIGSVEEDAAASDTTVMVRLNNVVRHAIDYARASYDGGDGWSSAKTNGASFAVNAGAAGVPVLGCSALVIAATNEAEAIYVKSDRTVLGSAKPILEFRLTEVAASTSDVDFDFGLASGGHASDFESVAAFAAFHRDGGDANIDTHSDDASTDRAPADSTIDLTQSVFNEYWIDARDDTDVKFYVDGVLVDTSSVKRILTGALATAMGIVIMIEKASGTATGEIRFSKARLRIMAE